MAATGCRKKTGFITPLPVGMTKNAQDPRAGTAVPLPPPEMPPVVTQTPDEITKFSGIKENPPGSREGWIEDREMFKANIVHFAFDSSNVRGEEQSKVTAVADYLKANLAVAVKVEGHCDERGTEEYNRALGNRRAIAIREELVRLGIDATRVDTITYGEDRPISQGTGEAVWRQNRRGEFILLTPPSR